MSDFPRGGDVQATRAWLDKWGFSGKFQDWMADALLGKEDVFIKNCFANTDEQQEQAEMLCGLLATARQTLAPQQQGK